MNVILLPQLLLFMLLSEINSTDRFVLFSLRGPKAAH